MADRTKNTFPVYPTNLEKYDTIQGRIDALIDEQEHKITKKELFSSAGLAENRERLIMERGSAPRPEELIALANALNTTPSILLTGRREQNYAVCESTGLYDSSVVMLQNWQQRKTKSFNAVRDVIDLLLRNPAFLLALHRYLCSDLDQISITDKDGQTFVFDLDNIDPDETNGFARYKRTPEEIERLYLLDYLKTLRARVQKERQETAHSAPSGSPADQKPV